MVAKSQHISLDDLLIHPGETISEILEDRNISQKELAIRTGFTEKHISTVINGQKAISAELAMKLEYALGISASFWRNLQTNYDLEVVAFNEKHNITAEEKLIAKEVKQTVEILTNQVLHNKSGIDSVLKIRQLLGVSNLKALAPLSLPQYRLQFAKNTSANIMYVWQYLCEKKAENQTSKKLDIEKLKNSLGLIKKVMHENAAKHIQLIQEILNDCGILFIVEKNVEKAPIKGLTVKTKKEQLMIALTIRGKFVDIFWFTLFHEIGHIINGDYLKNPKHNRMEEMADEFAASSLINETLYKVFILERDFSRDNIEHFAKKNNVLPAIVIGRLMNDKYIPWNAFKRETYIWITDN